jgi:hypothetical protein
MVEPVTEPEVESWLDWSARTAELLKYWRATLGYRGIVIVDTPYWSWTFDPKWALRVTSTDASLLGSQSQVVFANGRYSNGSDQFFGQDKATWAADILQHVDEFAILGSEYGWANAPYPVSWKWNQQFFRYLAETAVPAGINGALAFVWHWVDDNTMTENDGLTLSRAGRQYVAEFVHRLPPAQPSLRERSREVGRRK